ASYVILLAPDSCPTRRSSDLAPNAFTSPAASIAHSAPGAGFLLTDSIMTPPKNDFGTMLARVCKRNVNGGERTPADGGPLTIFPDRKSTRLNSSHVKISYAVF